MIQCVPNTVLPVDEAVINHLPYSYASPIKLDTDFLAMLTQFHGGTPSEPYFQLRDGTWRKIAWFTTFLSRYSPVSEPFQEATIPFEGDSRFEDRSVIAAIDDFVNLFDDCERICPFAALHSESGEPDTLRIYYLDTDPADFLCLDMSTTPQKVVLLNGNKAADQAILKDDMEVEEVDYDLICEVVSPSFSEFCSMLKTAYAN